MERKVILEFSFELCARDYPHCQDRASLRRNVGRWENEPCAENAGEDTGVTRDTAVTEDWELCPAVRAVAGAFVALLTTLRPSI